MAAIRDLIPSYLLAAMDEAKASAKTARLRVEIDRLAREEYARQGSDRWKADGLGKSHVRLDGTQDGPKVMVVKPAEFASYLGEHAPEYAITTITVPAAQLAAALEALEFAGVTVKSADAAPGPDAAGWVADNCRATPDPDTGGWVVQHVADGAVVASDVPGLGAFLKPARLVVSLDRDIKATSEREAIEEAEADLAGILADAASPTPLTAA